MLVAARGLSVEPFGQPLEALPTRLGRAVSDDCLTLDPAAELADEIAREMGIQPEGLAVNKIADTDTSCTRVHVTVTGRIEVHLRGPAAG